MDLLHNRVQSQANIATNISTWLNDTVRINKYIVRYKIKNIQGNIYFGHTNAYSNDCCGRFHNLQEQLHALFLLTILIEIYSVTS